MEIRVHSGRSFGVTLVQLAPAAWTYTMPSSEPVQIVPFSTGDSAMVKTVPSYSTLVWSLVMGPPEGPRVAGSWRVRSGEIACQLEPSSVDLKTTFAPAYSVFGSWGESTIGKVHWNRYLRSPAEWPIGLSGQGFPPPSLPVLVSFGVSTPP